MKEKLDRLTAGTVLIVVLIVFSFWLFILAAADMILSCFED
jgi:hypothetical protein